MESQIKEDCKTILEDRHNYIDSINEDEQMFPISIYSHFICGIKNNEMLGDIPIIDFDKLDFDKNIAMDFFCFGKGYFQLEERHFTDDFKNVRKHNSFNKNNLMYIIYNIRKVTIPNVLYSLANEAEKYQYYDMDLDEVFDEEVLDDYLSKVRRNNIEFTRYHLPVIRNFKLIVDTKYNCINCEIILLE
jgi:hypothetical protein